MARPANDKRVEKIYPQDCFACRKIEQHPGKKAGLIAVKQHVRYPYCRIRAYWSAKMKKVDYPQDCFACGRFTKTNNENVIEFHESIMLFYM